MSVTRQACRWTYVGDGVTTAFPFRNIIYAPEDLAVYLDGAQAQIVTGYVVTGTGQPGGGAVGFWVAPAAGVRVTIVSAIPATQQLAWTPGTPFPSDQLPAGLDRLTRLAQQTQASIGDTVHFPPSDPVNSGLLPAFEVRANKYLGFDAGGDFTVYDPATGFTSAADVNFVPPAPAMHGRTVQNKLRDTVSVFDFGAVGNGIADDTSALQDAFDSGKDILFPWTASGYLITTTLTLTTAAQQITFHGALVADPSFAGGDGYVLNITAAGVVLNNPRINCGKIASGVRIQGASCRLNAPTIWHMGANDTGVAIVTGADDVRINDPDVTQWLSTDAEYAVEANYTARGFYVNASNGALVGGVARWTSINLSFDANAATFYVRGLHAYNGNAGTPRASGKNIQVLAGAKGIFFDGCVFENGHIDLHSADVSLRNCWLNIDAGVNYSDKHVIRVYANGATNPEQLDIDLRQIDLPAGYAPLAFLPWLTNSWTGDWAGIDALTGTGNARRVRAAKGDIVIDGSDDSATPLHAFYKPSNGPIYDTYQIGSVAGMMVKYYNAGLTLDCAGAVTVFDVGGLGGGLACDTSGNMKLRAGSADRWKLATGGALQPMTDNAYSLGASGARASVIYAATGTINTSDGRLKTDVADSTLGLDFIAGLRPVSYKWIEGATRVVGQTHIDPDGNTIPAGTPPPDGSVPGDIVTETTPGTRTHWGLIAQEVKAALDAAGVADFAGWTLADKGDPTSQQGLRYEQFVPILIKAVQQLAARVVALEARP